MPYSPPDPVAVLEQLPQSASGECPYCSGNHYYSPHFTASNDYVYNQCTGCDAWCKSTHYVPVNGPA